MKNHILSFAACVTAIMFTSCSKEDTLQPEQSQETTIEVSITAELDEFSPASKATAEACIRLKWEGGETVYAYSALSDGTLSKPAELTASISGNAYVAVLNGTITAPTDANKTLYLVYSGCGTPSISNHTVTVAMNGTQASNKVPFVAYAKLTGVTGTDHSTDGLQAKFSFASSVINVNVTDLGSGVSLSTATMTGLAENCTITLGSTIDVGKSGDETAYTKTLSGSATTSGKAQFFLAVPQMAASPSRVLTVADKNGGKYSDNGVVSGAHSANSYVNTICCVGKEPDLLPGKFSVSATKQVQFTRGNLYYSTTDSKYHIETKQTDYNEGINDGYNNMEYDPTHVSHFFWSNITDWQTSGKEPWADEYQYSVQSTSDKFFCGEDNPMTVDGWSCLYALTGGNNGEWRYIFEWRTNASNLYKKCVSVSTIAGTATNCVVIAPDDWDYTNNPLKDTYSTEEWSAAESAGLVCLPAAGYRTTSYTYKTYTASYLHDGNYSIYYWSATPTNGSGSGYQAHCLQYTKYSGSDVLSVDPSTYENRNKGISVRLVSTVYK